MDMIYSPPPPNNAIAAGGPHSGEEGVWVPVRDQAVCVWSGGGQCCSGPPLPRRRDCPGEEKRCTFSNLWASTLLSVYPPFFLYPSFCLYIHPSFCTFFLYIHPSFYISTLLSIIISTLLSVYPPIFLSVDNKELLTLSWKFWSVRLCYSEV